MITNVVKSDLESGSKYERKGYCKLCLDVGKTLVNGEAFEDGDEPLLNRIEEYFRKITEVDMDIILMGYKDGETVMFCHWRNSPEWHNPNCPAYTMVNLKRKNPDKGSNDENDAQHQRPFGALTGVIEGSIKKYLEEQKDEI